MERVGSGPEVPDNEALLRRAVADGCLDAVGGFALRRYYAGARIEAHALIRLRWQLAPSPALEALLADAALWVDPPPAAVRGRLYDDGLEPVLGCAVRTTWTTFFGTRMSPAANVLVAGVPERIVAEVPLTEAQRRRGAQRRWGVPGVYALAAALVGVLAVPTHVVVANGLPVEIRATVAGDSFPVPAWGKADAWLWRWWAPVSAATVGGEAIDATEVAKSFLTVVYTPGSQAALAVEDVAYGGGAPKDTEFLPLAAVHRVWVDDLLVEPPARVEVQNHETVHRRHLMNVLTDGGLATDGSRLGFLVNQYGVEAAVGWAETSLRFAPDQPGVARFLEPEAGPDRLPYWTDLHLRAPRSVALWRRWGELQADPVAFLQAARAAAAAGDEAAPVVVALFSPDPTEAEAAGRAAVGGHLGPTGRAALLEARADAAARLGRWSDAEAFWTELLRDDEPSAALARRERARVRLLAGLPPAEALDVDKLPDDERIVEDALRVVAAPAEARARLDAVSGYDEPRRARLTLAMAMGDAAEARRTVNTLALGPDAVEYAFPIEAGAGGDERRLRTLLLDVPVLDPGWTRVAAAAAAALDLPSAARWAEAARGDGDGGPALVDVEERAARPPAADAWLAWAPRHWPLASLAAAWFARRNGDAPAAAAWRTLARAEAVPGELLGPPLPSESP